jgi:hypothetical protein
MQTKVTSIFVLVTFVVYSSLGSATSVTSFSFTGGDQYFSIDAATFNSAYKYMNVFIWGAGGGSIYGCTGGNGAYMQGNSMISHY